jgi:hypothetical protein
MRIRTRLKSPVAFAFLATVLSVSAIAQQPAVFQFEFTNAKQYPAHWLLKFGPDGSGQFDSDGGQADVSTRIQVGELHRQVKVSPQFAAQVFAAARQKRWFGVNCESHLKVAFQGNKKLSFSGPEGSGSCEYNYSKDKEIQALGESLLAVESTLLFGATLDKLLLHDRLGVDQEMESLATAVQEGNAIEVGTIRETLNRIATDEQVLERARRRARKLLAQADSAEASGAQASTSQ